MKANLAGGQFAHALFVFGNEVRAKLGEHLVGGRFDMPSITGHGKDTSVFEHGECEVFDGVVRQGVIASHGDELNFA